MNLSVERFFLPPGTPHFCPYFPLSWATLACAARIPDIFPSRVIFAVHFSITLSCSSWKLGHLQIQFIITRRVEEVASPDIRIIQWLDNSEFIGQVAAKTHLQLLIFLNVWLLLRFRQRFPLSAKHSSHIHNRLLTLALCQSLKRGYKKIKTIPWNAMQQYILV